MCECPGTPGVRTMVQGAKGSTGRTSPRTNSNTLTQIHPDLWGTKWGEYGDYSLL